MFSLLIESPFAAFRPFITGNFRPTAPFLTPSAAYGLLLNLAGIEMRDDDDGKSAMTLIRKGDLPEMEIALGAPAGKRPWRRGRSLDQHESSVLPTIVQLYQQLHNYPIGRQGREHAAYTMGNKYNITPVRRSLLSGLRAVVCFDNCCNPADIGERVCAGLRGELGREYGLPFLGDNNLLPDRIEVLNSPPPCHWFVPVVDGGDGTPPDQGIGRLTITIDREDSSGTRSRLFGPTPGPSDDVPKDAWISIGYSRS